MKRVIRGIVLVLTLAGVASPQPATEPKAEPPKPDAAKPDAAKKPDPPKDKPFAEIIKEARQIDGLFRLYQTEEKVYLEIGPDQLDRTYMLSVTRESGIGERGIWAAEVSGEVPIQFRKRARNVQLVIPNTGFRAEPATPQSRFVARSFSDSILGLAKFESEPHPERKSWLIDLGTLLLTDLPLISWNLEATFRIGYRFDAKNSFFGKVQAFERNVGIETVNHYAVERPPLPPLLAPGQTPPPTPRPPRNLPDIRSMQLRLRYDISELPGPGFRPRLADDRIGYFHTEVRDYTQDIENSPVKRYVHRWRLEKQDAAAKLSPPKQPIVFWIENTVPEKYRNAVRDGALMWNKAFEKIGFQDAVVVRQQPDDADWDPADVRYNTIRWIAAEAAFAQGPSRVNPFTGEIYDADIRFSEAIGRYRRQEVVEVINPLAAPAHAAVMFRPPWRLDPGRLCNYATEAVADAAFATDLLDARGIEPDSPEADRMVQSFIREITAHEVGHTLGLRHNFRASTVRSIEETQNAELTARDGLTASVMDYIPTNLAARGGKQGEYHQSALGPYDYWAIEYGYKPIDAATTDQELPELQKIASRAAEPALAYATDEDAGFGGGAWDMDPGVNRFDMGPDPLKYTAHRVRLAREVIANIETKIGKPGEGYQVLRRSFENAIGQQAQAFRFAAKLIGGVRHYRDHIGDPGGRLPFDPVPAAHQREALKLVRDHLFAPDAFRYPPQLLNKLNNERFSDFSNFAATQTRFDLPIHDIALGLQRSTLDRLFHATVLKRILDSEVKVALARDAFRIGDLFTGVQDSIWAELKGAGPVGIDSFRRSLQREHLRKLTGMLLRDASVPEDAQTMSRHGLTVLRGQLQGALPRASTLETRVHLTESISRIDESLEAGLQRTTF
jgi:hypothetical protein